MKCRLIAAGTRLPDWVNGGFRDYQKRLRTPLVLELHEITVATRRAGESPERAVQREGVGMLAAIGKDDYVVALEITGKSMSTEQLSVWLADRLREGRPLSLLIGGPDGLAPQCLDRADQRWSLSPLTLPHALVRVVVAEQIYRAMSLLAGHPYHRA
ncbi:MAG TPA: 23S rRNA (pseudouridine(1915)-N(3))-methyltransferase RlmH [Steroidobacteraceae bacterium]|jgi:23S rRNA (pseudouridine1915-N3)-methyltransferase|nr:23S rRNA (pseudouridine(1915)-N(3))-methyltransferase RlmH [Steroidobacteraceae bacterium]